MTRPTNYIFALCHNLLIHSPEKGKLLLNLLNQPTDNQKIISNLSAELISTGEYGEQLALENLESKGAAWSKTWAEFLSNLSSG